MSKTTNDQITEAKSRVGQKIKVNFVNTKRSVECEILDKTGIWGFGEEGNVRQVAYVKVKEVGGKKTHAIPISDMLKAYPSEPSDK